MASIGKLYYTPTSCGAASFITGRAAGVQFDNEIVDLRSHKTVGGADFYTINPKGNVPTLVLPNGKVLNEGVAVLQYIADQNPSSGLAPAFGTIERYELINALNYVASEVHKAIGGLFNPNLDEAGKARQHTLIAAKLKYLNEHELNGKKFLLFDRLTVADIYLYIVLSWSGYLKVDLSPYPNVQNFYQHIAGLDVVKNAHKEMNEKSGGGAK